MANRLEYKYLVPVSKLDIIRSEMRPYVELDKYSAKRDQQEYTVRSIYYDSPMTECYHQKIDGIKVRKKFRIRGYNEPGNMNIVFLEIKRKYVNFIDKNRAPVLCNNLDSLFTSRDIEKHIISLSGNGKEKDDARRFLYYYFLNRLSPMVLVIYDREAFYSKFDNSLRLTFDKNLRSTIYPSLDMLYQEDQVQYAMPRYFIFEVKFYGKLPHWIRSIVKRHQIPRMALSKYTICLDSHKDRKKYSYGRSKGINRLDNNPEICKTGLKNV